MATRADKLWTVLERINTVHALSSQDLRDVEGISLVSLGSWTRSSSCRTRTSSPGLSTSSYASSGVGNIANGETRLTSEDHHVPSQETSYMKTGASVSVFPHLPCCSILFCFSSWTCAKRFWSIQSLMTISPNPALDPLFKPVSSIENKIVQYYIHDPNKVIY